jgi:hypothetical protein
VEAGSRGGHTLSGTGVNVGQVEGGSRGGPMRSGTDRHIGECLPTAATRFKSEKDIADKGIRKGQDPT